MLWHYLGHLRVASWYVITSIGVLILLYCTSGAEMHTELIMHVIYIHVDAVMLLLLLLLLLLQRRCVQCCMCATTSSAAQCLPICAVARLVVRKHSHARQAVEQPCYAYRMGPIEAASVRQQQHAYHPSS
jgi:Mn2+/Fe2+ NRAMP family transporter